VHFSALDNLSIGVMTTWIASPFILALKYTIETSDEKLNFGLGSLTATSGYLNQGRGFGSLNWGMVTYGDKKLNATLSAGYGFFNWNFFGGNYFKPGVYNPNVTPPSIRLGLRDGVQGPIIGLGVMATVSNKATLIFDLMYVNSTRKRYYQDANYTYDDNSNLTSVSYSDVVENGQGITNFFIFMPGMRFQTKPNRAFQFALAGVVGKTRTTGSGYNWTNEFSFPVPTCTWYFKF
jgi:hypothetical protein